MTKNTRKSIKKYKQSSRKRRKSKRRKSKRRKSIKRKSKRRKSRRHRISALNKPPLIFGNIVIEYY